MEGDRIRLEKVHDSSAETRMEGGEGGVVEAPVEQVVVLRRPVPTEARSHSVYQSVSHSVTQSLTHSLTLLCHLSGSHSVGLPVRQSGSHAVFQVASIEATGVPRS